MKRIILLILILSVFLISGCKEISYLDQVPYRTEEAYTIDEPYEVRVPYDATESYQEEVPYQETLILDKEGQPVKELTYEVTAGRSYRDFMGDVKRDCETQADIVNPNQFMVTIDIQYEEIDDVKHNPIKKENVVIDALDTYTISQTFGLRGYGAGCSIKINQITLKESENVHYTNVTKYKIEDKERTITKYKTEVRYKTVVKTRPVTKYKSVLVTEKVFPWQ